MFKEERQNELWAYVMVEVGGEESNKKKWLVKRCARIDWMKTRLGIRI